MLYAARLARGLENPILGINSGRLGFMNDVSIEEMYSALDSLIKKNYTLTTGIFYKQLTKKASLLCLKRMPIHPPGFKFYD